MPSNVRIDSGIILGDDPAPTTDYEQGQADTEQPMDALVSRPDETVVSDPSTRESWPGDEQGNRSTSQNENEYEDGVNKDFQDVRATGKWGAVTRTEKLLVAGIVIAVLVAIVVVAVVLTGSNKGGDDSQEAEAEASPSPSMAPTFPPFTQTEQLLTILALVGNLTSTKDSLEILPADPDFYKDLYLDTLQPPQVRAMSWVLHVDPRKEGPTSEWLIPRYGLATLYYATGGPEWTNSNGWLTESHTCDWYGLLCDRTRTVLEQLDLQSNNLQNDLPNEIALLSDVRSIWFRRNRLTGKLPALAFNDLTQLHDLFLESNQFTGRIPAILAESVPPLATLFLQQNQFVGIYPAEFCAGPLETSILERFGVDCARNGCICCSIEDNCF